LPKKENEIIVGIDRCSIIEAGVAEELGKRRREAEYCGDDGML
jgi:hypothetical protein